MEQEVLGLCSVPCGAEADKTLWTKKKEAKEHGQMFLSNNPQGGKMRGPAGPLKDGN